METPFGFGITKTEYFKNHFGFLLKETDYWLQAKFGRVMRFRLLFTLSVPFPLRTLLSEQDLDLLVRYIPFGCITYTDVSDFQNVPDIADK